MKDYAPVKQPCPRCQGYGAIRVERAVDLKDPNNYLPPEESMPCPAGCSGGFIWGPPC